MHDVYVLVEMRNTLLEEYVRSVLEDTAWKRHNVAFDKLAPLKNWVNRGTYVTFTDVNKVGINVRFSYANALGIWTYPFDDRTYDEIINGTIRFAGEKEFIHVIKPRIPSAILDIDSLGWADVTQLTKEANIPIIKADSPATSLDKSVRKFTKSDPLQQAKVYRKLGFDGIVYTSKHVAVFFAVNAIKHLDVIQNPRFNP